MASPSELPIEIAHVLFIDIVGYSKLPVDEQKDLLEELNGVARNSAQFRSASAANKLARLPTGDGMALVFRTSLDAPVRCAMEITKGVRDRAKLPIRMGVHSGPIESLVDVSGRENVAGDGINFAQRVMDCGDAGHILLSERVAEDLSKFRQWKSQLHKLGEVEVKHGVRISITNFYSNDFGNPELPRKVVSRQPPPPPLVKPSWITKITRRLLPQFLDLAVDIGTTNISIYQKDKGVVLHESSRPLGLAKHWNRSDEKCAFLGGRIASIERAIELLKYCLAKIKSADGPQLRVRLLIAIDPAQTEVEKRCFREIGEQAGAYQVYLVEQPLAAAVGLRVERPENAPTMIVNLGGGATQVALITFPTIELARSRSLGGEKLDEALVRYLKRERNCWIEEESAEQLKLRLLSLREDSPDREIEIYGKDYGNGGLKKITVTASELRAAVREPVANTIKFIRSVTESFDPRTIVGLNERGMFLIGGGALLPGLEELVKAETGLAERVPTNAVSAVVEGAGWMLPDLSSL